MPKIEFKPIGYIRSGYKTVANMSTDSRQKRDLGEIHVYKKYAQGLEKIEGFSHLYVIFYFHKSRDYKLLVHPRPRPDIEAGVFATHSPRRPNGIGISIVELEKVEGNIIYFKGVDMFDRTPVLDIKPVTGNITITSKGWLGNDTE